MKQETEPASLREEALYMTVEEERRWVAKFAAYWGNSAAAFERGQERFNTYKQIALEAKARRPQ